LVRPALLVRGLSGSIKGRRWVAGPEQPVIIGRAVAAAPNVIAITIPDPRVSSQHCRIELSDGAFRVIDLNSRNGVLINGNRIPPGASEALRDGDVLTVAELVLEVRIVERSQVTVVESKNTSTSVTIVDTQGGQGTVPLVLDLMPYPLAVGIRKVRHAIGSADLVQESLRSFEVILRFQTTVALSEYLARGTPDEQVQALLTAFCQRPFSLGRWLELYSALTRALAGDKDLVVEELASMADGESIRRWKASATRLVELRNTLLHGDGLGTGAVEAVAPELILHFNEILARLAFWVGYRFIAVEPGSWSDTARVFLYPCRLLVGCATPFEARVLQCASPLPPRVPIVVSRDGKRRLSLGPLQAILPGPDRQLHWFWLSDFTVEQKTMATYPANFRMACPSRESLKRLLEGQDLPSQARAAFSSDLTSGVHVK
jgi:pSer/pThr/pTyr-binding forkhead associated (FHA) protein